MLAIAVLLLVASTTAQALYTQGVRACVCVCVCVCVRVKKEK